MKISFNIIDMNVINPCYIFISCSGIVWELGSFFSRSFSEKKGKHIRELVEFDKGVSIETILTSKKNALNITGIMPASDLRVSGNFIAIEQGFIYTARPSINSLKEAISAGLDMACFGPGDPTYKLLLSGHMQRNLLKQYRDLAEQLTETRKALIEPIANMWEISAFLAHDFKNYLNAIGMSADKIEMLDSAAAGPSLDMIRQAVLQASSLADAISDIAKNQKFEQAAFELHRILRANLRLFEALLSDGIRLELRLTDGPLILRGNIPVFIGCLMTIVSNAKQALGDEGFVAISTEKWLITEVDDELGLLPGSYAVITIEDNGPGIPPHLLAEVARPFVSTKGEGRGLGLASVAEYCRRQDGALKIRSTPRAGTKVELILPCASTT